MFKSLKAVGLFILALGELDELVGSHGVVHLSKTSSCITVSLHNGSFIATADYNTRMENLQFCLDFMRAHRSDMIDDGNGNVAITHQPEYDEVVCTEHYQLCKHHGEDACPYLNCPLVPF